MPSGSPGSPSLRFRLFLLAATGLLPLALVLLVSAGYLASQRVAGTQRAALELSRAIATAVDAELESTVAILDNLALGAQLSEQDEADLPRAFASLADRAVQRQGWRTLNVSNARGEVLLRASQDAGRGAVPVEAGSMAQLLRSRRPTVGRVARGPLGREAFPVRIPILREGQLRYVLTAVVPVERMLAVVQRQRLATGWVVGVFDQEGSRVARSIATDAPRYSPTLEALVRANGQEGMGATYTIEGVKSHTGFSRVPASQWVVAVGIPVSDANQDLHRLLAALGAGSALSLVAMAWLTWRMARSISAPVDRLRQAAANLGAGQPVQLPPLGMEELETVGRALRQASEERAAATEHAARGQAEREQLLARVEDALRLAEEANRNKDEFLALLGHELRNPLAPIGNALHLMQLKGDSATAPERAVVQRQLQYVTRLVDDLLDASRITSKRFVIHLRPVRPVTVLEQTLESVQPMLQGRRLALEVSDAARALWVRADEARLVQIFNNLLGNALKFTEPTGSIEVQALQVQDSLEVVIRDDGAGMATPELARAFELFYQGPQAARRHAHGGLGLGLAIVRTLVEMHHGSVRVQSEGAGRGTTVTLRLPATKAPPDEPPARRPSLRFSGTPVLVVDDNVDAADTLATVLRLSGFSVRVAYSPQQALAAIEHAMPAVAVLDIGMPEMDGYELARRLRSHVPAFSGRLIALTGYGQEQDVRRALEAGFDAHLTKPVAPDALLQLIARLTAGQVS